MSGLKLDKLTREQRKLQLLLR